MKLFSLFRYQRTLLNALNAVEKKEYTHLIFLSFTSILLELFGQALLFVILIALLDFDQLTPFLERLGTTNVSNIQLIAVLAVLFLVKNIVIMALSNLQFNKLFGITSTLSSDIYRGTFRTDLKAFRKLVSGERLNEINSVTNSLPNFVILPSITVITELSFMVLVIGVLAFWFPVLMGFLVLFLVPPTMLFLWWGRKRLDDHGRTISAGMPKIYEAVSHAVFGFSEIKLFNLEKKYTDDFEKHRERVYHSRIKSQLLSGVAPQRLMEVLAVFGILVVAWYFNRFSTAENIATILALFASIAFRLLPSLNRIVSSMNTFQTFSNILEFIPDNRSTIVVEQKLDKINFKSLNINSLKFSFGEDNKVLENVSLEVKKGEFVGIYGGSGLGKTTLLNAVMGFYKVEPDTILVNDQPTENVLREWQNTLGYVKQDAFIQSGSVESNVAFGHEHPDKQRVRSLLEQVKLLDWVESLPDKLQTEVGENGSQLSGGQRQRLALARCLYRDPEFLVFDEATNALDEGTKAEILDLLNELKLQGKTLLLVSHDLDSFKFCDRIFQLENGRLTKRK
ncbi:MAG: ABC transporter ATP-binding protein [Bacteroidia bacterium]|nr:ABC transporter ATP-binding protein [Bacteroidia bacterium]